MMLAEKSQRHPTEPEKKKHATKATWSKKKNKKKQKKNWLNLNPNTDV
jgi:hypothetical protein